MKRDNPEQRLNAGHFKKVPPWERFHLHYTREPSGCWLWTGKKHQFGYGFFFPTRNRGVTAHRYSWELHNGPIPDGLHVLHKCDIPGCVNPDHLFVGNNQDNSHDKAVKGRAARKLTAEQVREIREDSRPGVVLAAVYGVAPCTINDITKRRTWRHV